MPSVSEGLNLTPIESTFCGCPSIIVDGAIGEIFENEINCLVVPPNHTEIMVEAVKVLMNNETAKNSFKKYMGYRIKGYTWSNVANKIKEVL